MNSEIIFEKYESIRAILPRQKTSPTSKRITNIKEVLDEKSCLLFDAFGVLNAGDRPIKKAVEFLNTLKSEGTPFLILSNSASTPKKEFHKKMCSMGYNIELEDTITSREVLWSQFPKTDKTWGIIAQKQELELPIDAVFQDEEGFLDCDGFIFLCAKAWNDSLHVQWKESLRKNPREVWLANPDITAPRGKQVFSKEAGFYTLLEDKYFSNSLRAVGKPFDVIFKHAMHIVKKRWGISKDNLIMVGDTLHTDILGSNSMGIKNILIEDYGFFEGLSSSAYIEKSGIFPDFIMSRYS